MISRWNDALSGILPEHRITISSDSHQNSITLSPVSQLMAGACCVALVGWMTVGTATVLLSNLADAERRAQTEVLTESYEARLAEAHADRDGLIAARDAAEQRLTVAQARLAEQQTELLAALEERRELHASLTLMRDELHAALKARDAAIEESSQLVAELSDLTGNLEERFGQRADVAETLQTLVATLEETVTARDTALGERSALQADIAALELRMQVNAERQDRLVTQLEEAVQVSFSPLEEMFKTSGMNVDDLVSSIRRNYSGTGGPLIEASVSTRSFDDPDLTRRFSNLMEGMDRINVMRMAADKLPYAMPVHGGYRFTSGFGTRRDPKTGGYRSHNGIDLAGARGTPIHATGDGVVVFAGRQSGFGNLVKIRHEFGFETLYAHQSRILVKEGQRITRGQKIGEMGSTGRSTGTHLHYEVRIGGKPVNPMTYIKAASNVF